MAGVKLGVEDFVHLHNHTHFSVLDGLTKVPALIKRVKEFGMEAVAMTDHGTMSGVIEFYKEAKANSLKPIIGMEAYIASRKLTDKEPSKDKQIFHLTVLAMNDSGYRNLMRLSTIANLEGFYYKPRLDFETLSKYQDGLIILSGCIGGEVADSIRNGQISYAYDIALKYKKLLGDRYYIEIQDHGHPDHDGYWDEQEKVNSELIKLSKELKIPCVLTCDAHYLRPEDKDAHEILLCVQTGSYLNDKDRMSLANFDLSVTDPVDVIKRWGKTHPEVILNSKKIADRCDVSINLGSILIPKFPVPEGEDEKTYLHKLVWQGLAWRYAEVSLRDSEKLGLEQAKLSLSKEIIDRAEYELKVINEMGFNGYFLIVQDFIRWGKDRGIVFGPGRGSAAGSIVAYSLRITEIEPLKYNLMFERFLNPGRISMPDIDIDIQDTRRDEVITYCVEKYGHDRVANIVTFGRMAARNAVRDVARVLEVPYADADRLAKMIPPPIQGRHIPLKTSIKEDKVLSQEYKNSSSAKRIFDLAMQLEGTIRSHGIHAAGVVIAPDDLFNFTPLEMAQKGVVATQYSMGPIEELGLLKMDFLGLANLTILKNALRIIKKVYGNAIALDNIPIDDDKTLNLFRLGDTTGVFQFESAGMRRYLKELKPNLFEDIIAMNALYRPGPMQEIPRFIKGKNNQSSITYLHKSLEPILEDTYGVMVYQEQIIKLLQLVAGYSPGEADLVRKAIGKKKRDIMQAEEPKFIEGCLKQGLTNSQAKQLWAQIQPFADYSFNKAHATCYAQIAYWTAYLKAHYPAAFMAALMTSDYDDTDRLAIEISECQKMGIPVLPPDINESFNEFGVIIDEDKTSIRFGLSAIKNVGSNAVEEIIRTRAGKPFNSFEDYLLRVDYHAVNKKSLESLIKAGVFDRFHSRKLLLDNMDLILAFTSRTQKQANSGQTDLFGGTENVAEVNVSLNLPSIKDTNEVSKEQLMWERELLGLYLSSHPLAHFEPYLKNQAKPISSITTDMDGSTVQIGGIVNAVREITTKKGQKMAFVRIEDLSGDTEIILFPNSYQQTQNLWTQDKVVIVKGKVNAKDRDGNLSDEVKVLVDEAREITQQQAQDYIPTAEKNQVDLNVLSGPGAKGIPNPNARLYIKLESSDDTGLLRNLKKTIDNYSGDTEVVLVLDNQSKRQAIKLPSGIDIKGDGPKLLRELIGNENVAVK